MPAAQAKTFSAERAERLVALRAKVARYEIAEARERYEDNFSEFFQAAWPSIDSAQYQSCWAIDAFADHLEAVTLGHIPRLLANFPPRCSKSNAASVAWPAWIWARASRSFLSGPQVKFLSGSYNSQLALQYSNLTRRLLLSPWYQKHWGDRFALRVDQNSKSQFDNTKGGSRVATSVRGGLLGRGGDVICVDDPHNTETEKKVESDADRVQVRSWWQELSSTRLNDPKQTAIVVVMQRLHQADLSGLILDSDEDWVHLCLPMEFDERRRSVTVALPQYEDEEPWQDPRTMPGELMWPERFGPKEVAHLKSRLGPYMSSGRLQQSPVPKGGGIIKRDWWQPWDQQEAQRYGLEWHGGRKEFPLCELVVASLDTSYGEKQINDYNAMTVWGLWLDRAKNRRVMLMYAWAKRLALHGKVITAATGEAKVNFQQRQRDNWGLVEWVADTCKRYRVNRLIIENKTRGRDVANEINRQYARERWGVELVDPVGDKTARGHSVVPMFTDDMIFAPDTKWADEVITNCVARGTPIITDSGVMPIEEVKVGDRVLTHKGRFRPVIATSSRSTGSLMRLEPKALDPITVTADHLFFAQELTATRQPHGVTTWTKAGEMKARRYRRVVRKGKRVVEAYPSPCHAATLPIIGREVPLNEIDLREWATLPTGKDFDFLHDDEVMRTSHGKIQSMKWRQRLDYGFGRVIGLYLAEGSSSRQVVNWTFHINETKFIEEVRCFVEEKLGCRARVEQRGWYNSAVVSASLPLVESFFAEFGKYAHEKRIAPWVWNAPDDFIRGVIEAYMDGDGHDRPGGRTATTVSLSLAWGIRLLALRLGLKARINVLREAGEMSIDGRVFRNRRTYTVGFLTQRENEGAAKIIGDIAAYSLMKSAKIEGKQQVFDLQVAEDNSFCTTSGLVHNCEIFPKGEFDDLYDTVTQFLNWGRVNGILVRADEMTAALEDEMAYKGPQISVAEQYGV